MVNHVSTGNRLLIVGNPDVTHVGRHFLNAATSSGLTVELCDTNLAFSSNWPVTKFNWWLRGHRPAALLSFSQKIVETCRRFKPHLLLATGICPIESRALEQIGRLGIERINFLTDDPWNPAHKSSWFMKGLPLYDHVFTPRRANVQDLFQIGCQQVSYSPFAYAPELHFTEPPSTPEEEKIFASDIMFAGGADPDRVGFVKELIAAGFNVALYGGYWRRFIETKAYGQGHADPSRLRKAVGGAKVALCLVRRANRDGHAMRSFEVPAIGACMLIEDTAEHREIFGPDGDAVAYFRDNDEMVEKMRWLIQHDVERKRLAQTAHALITSNPNSYRDRLHSMLIASGLCRGAANDTVGVTEGDANALASC